MERELLVSLVEDAQSHMQINFERDVLMRNLQTDADALDAEIKRLQARKARRENAVDRLKNRMLYAMQTVGADATLGGIIVPLLPILLGVARQMLAGVHR